MTDLTNEEWESLQSLFEPYWTGRPMTNDLREIVNAILHKEATGSPWRLLPSDFAPWTSVHYYYRKWQDDGTLARLQEQMRRTRQPD